MGPWVRGSVRPSVGHAFLKTTNLNKFNKIEQNSRLFAPVGRVTALFLDSLGKFHQSLRSYKKAVCTTKREQFMRRVKDASFSDFLVLSPTVAVCLYDGLIM